MADERRKNIAVGLTTLTGTIGLIALLVLFGYLPSIFTSGYQVTIELPSAGGLHPGSPVRLNGIRVGEVESVQLSPNLEKGTVVESRISEQGLRLPQSVRARLSSPLLGGGSRIELVVDSQPSEGQTSAAGSGAAGSGAAGSETAGSGNAIAMLPTDGSAVIQGKSGGITEQITNELQAAMAEPTRQFQELTATIKDFTDVWRKVGLNVRKMTDPRTPSDVDAGEVVGNMASVVTRIDRRLGEMKTTLTQLNQWVGDKQLRNDVKTTVRSVSSASSKIEQTVGSLQEQATALADDLSQITDSAKSLFNQAEHGDGTLGKALSNPDLYQNLNDAAARMKTAVDEVRLLVEKWKKEGLPVQF